MDTNPVHPILRSGPSRVVGPHRERPRPEDEPDFEDELDRQPSDRDPTPEKPTPEKPAPAKGGEPGSTIDVVG